MPVEQSSPKRWLRHHVRVSLFPLDFCFSLSLFFRTFEPLPPKKPLSLRQENSRAGAAEVRRELRQDKSKKEPAAANSYSVSRKKERTSSDSSQKAKLHVSSKSFTDIKKVKSATASLSSTASNLALRSKVTVCSFWNNHSFRFRRVVRFFCNCPWWSFYQVIQFNDKKCSLGSLGMAAITQLDNSFKVIHQQSEHVK